jgi:threonine dehydrogenase-like Zn-dependent dehydrogenase
MKAGKVNPKTYITHTVGFEDVKDNFKSWLDPKTGVIKAMVHL